MSETIFTKFIKGELPCDKIYEDERTFAFLDIDPLSDGHILVISKQQVDKVYKLDPENYHALFASVRKAAEQIEKVLGVRAGLVVEGLSVPHAHVHVVPLYDDDVLNLHHGYPVKKDPESLKELARRLTMN